MIKDNKTCIICGTKYSYCPNCSEFSKYPTWMTLFHDENCKELYFITSGYLAGEISAEKAKERYNKCDLTNRKNFNNNVKRVLSELFDEEKEEKKSVPEDFMNKPETVSEDKIVEQPSKRRTRKTTANDKVCD